MEVNSSGSTILYLQSENNSPQRNCLSVINSQSFLSLFFWNSLFFSAARNSLFFRAFFPSFPGILGVRQGQKILVFLVVFRAFFQKNKGRKDRVWILRYYLTGESERKTWSQNGNLHVTFEHASSGPHMRGTLHYTAGSLCQSVLRRGCPSSPVQTIQRHHGHTEGHD